MHMVVFNGNVSCFVEFETHRSSVLEHMMHLKRSLKIESQTPQMNVLISFQLSSILLFVQ